MGGYSSKPLRAGDLTNRLNLKKKPSLADRRTTSSSIRQQWSAMAVYHNLELVSGNLRHFARIPQLRLNPILANSR
jgi:predicted nucleic acid-binding protein